MAANINLGKLAFVPPSPSTIPFRSPIGTLKASDPVESDDVVTLGVLGNATAPLKQYGILPWSALTDYPVNGLAMGLDGAIYQALQPSGPGNGGAESTDNPLFWGGAFLNIPKMQIFGTPGTYTWTRPIGCKFIRVRVAGGGGGSGGAPATGAGQFSSSASGGGGGGYAEGIISNVSDLVSVTVGAGGAGGTTSGSGATGGTSSFGNYLSATGGQGSNVGQSLSFGTTTGASIAQGGQGVGGDINLYGGQGTRATVFNNSISFNSYETQGTCLMFGVTRNGNDLSRLPPGTGASAASQASENSPAVAGNSGSQGMVIVESW